MTSIRLPSTRELPIRDFIRALIGLSPPYAYQHIHYALEHISTLHSSESEFEIFLTKSFSQTYTKINPTKSQICHIEMPRLRISFNSIAHIYDKTRALPEHVMKCLLKTLTDELSGYRTILDAGVGTGRFAKPLQESGFEVFGIDIANKMIRRATERGVSNLFLGDICFLPFKENSFDATVCIHVLHLVSEWKTALLEICRVTRRVMVSMNYARENPMWKAYDRLLKKYGYERHRPGKGEWELKKLVKPSKSVFVASFETKTDERLTCLSQRAYSHQWKLPESVNEKIVNELKSRFAGKVFPQELYLLIWDINRLKAFCGKS